MDKDQIVRALADDMDNSALGIICAELEGQGYEVFMDGQAVTAQGFWNGEYSGLESNMVVTIDLLLDGRLTEKCVIEFVDYHEISITALI